MKLPNLEPIKNLDELIALLAKPEELMERLRQWKALRDELTRLRTELADIESADTLMAQARSKLAEADTIHQTAKERLRGSHGEANALLSGAREEALALIQRAEQKRVEIITAAESEAHRLTRILQDAVKRAEEREQEASRAWQEAETLRAQSRKLIDEYEQRRAKFEEALKG